MANANATSDKQGKTKDTEQSTKSESGIRIPDIAVPFFKVARKLALSKVRVNHHAMYLNECVKDKHTPKGLQ